MYLWKVLNDGCGQSAYLHQIVVMQLQRFLAVGECVAGLFAQCGQSTLLGAAGSQSLAGGVNAAAEQAEQHVGVVCGVFR